MYLDYLSLCSNSFEIFEKYIENISAPIEMIKKIYLIVQNMMYYSERIQRLKHVYYID